MDSHIISEGVGFNKTLVDIQKFFKKKLTVQQFDYWLTNYLISFLLSNYQVNTERNLKTTVIMLYQDSGENKNPITDGLCCWKHF